MADIKRIDDNFRKKKMSKKKRVKLAKKREDSERRLEQLRNRLLPLTGQNISSSSCSRYKPQHVNETVISSQRGFRSFTKDRSWTTNEAVQQNEVLELERSLRDLENKLTVQRIQSNDLRSRYESSNRQDMEEMRKHAEMKKVVEARKMAELAAQRDALQARRSAELNVERDFEERAREDALLKERQRLELQRNVIEVPNQNKEREMEVLRKS